jgi:hypothetical protein
MIIEVVHTCLTILQAIKKCRDEMKANWADCKRLADRCLAYQPILDDLLTNDNDTSRLQALNNLCATLQSANNFIQQFSERTYFRGLSRMICRQKHAGELATLNSQLDRSATDFHLVYDVMKRRKENIDVSVFIQF